jgi:hypothetical protein
MDLTDPGPLGDRTNPTMRGSSIKSAPISAEEDGTFGPLSNGEVDGPASPGDEWDDGRLRALAHDLEGAMPSLEAEVLDVGLTCLGDPQAVQSEEHHQGRVLMIDPLCGKEKTTELVAIETPTFARMDLRSPDVLSWVGADPAVDVSEAVEAADGREASIDGRRSEIPIFHVVPIELDVRSFSLENLEVDGRRPREETLEIVSVGVERPALVASKVCHGSQFGFVEGVALPCRLDEEPCVADVHWNLPKVVGGTIELSSPV